MKARFCPLLLVITCLCLSLPAVASTVDLLQAGQPAPRQGILLDVPTSFKVLEGLEDYPRLKEENAVLRALVAKSEALDEIRVEREKLYQERIAFLEMQAEKWKQLNAATLALATQQQEVKGTWFDRLRRDLGTFTLGGIAATAIIAAIAF